MLDCQDVTEIDLPSRLDRAWALGPGRDIALRASREDLVLAGGRVEDVDVLAAGALHLARRNSAVRGKRLALRAPSEVLVARLAALDPGEMPTDDAVRAPEPFLERIGHAAWRSARHAAQGFAFAVEMFAGVADLLLRRERTWPGSTWRQLYDLGATALPVVLLLTGLIGFTLALLMGQQLEQYGASIHLATLMGVSFVREVGPLLTAVILAGRSGSAIAAELASMTVQEEIDALRTMGARESVFLVAPRLLALCVSLPFLALFASACGILSGLLVAVFRLGLSPDTYFQILSEAIEPKDIWTTFLKSAVFAAIIAFLACRIGLSTRGGSDAVGRSTTRTVVSGIFWTIIADCIFALVLYL